MTPYRWALSLGQARFDLLTSRSYQTLSASGLKARGQLNRLAGEIGLIRKANGEDGVTLSISHSLCTGEAGVMR